MGTLLEGPLTHFIGPDADGVFNRADKHFSIPDFAGFCGFDDGVDRAVQQVVLDHELDLDLRQKIHRVFTASINFGVTLLPAKALHLTDSHTLDPQARKGFFDFFQLKGLDDGLDLFHAFGADSRDFEKKCKQETEMR